MKHYKRKTSIVEALQWNGYNLQEVKDFTGSNADVEYGANNDNDVVADIIIHTNGCDVRLKKGDYIIKNQYGDYDCISKEQIKSDYVVVSTDKV